MNNIYFSNLNKLKPQFYPCFQAFLSYFLLFWGLIPSINVHGQDNSLHAQLQLGLEQQKERDHKKAIETFDLAIREFPLKANEDSIKATIYHRLGVSHYYLKNRQEAIQAWENAINLRNQFLIPNHIDIVKTHINIANSYLTLDQNRNAANALNTALELLNSQAKKDVHNLSRVYESLGLTANTQGDYETAIQYLTQSFTLKKEIFPNEPWELINITTRIFDVYKGIGDKNKMIEYAKLSLQYSEATPNDGDQYLFDLANSYNNLGIAYSASIKTKEAIIQFEKSLLINQKYEDRFDFLGINYNNLILQYNRKGDYVTAIEYSNKAKNIFSSNPSLVEYLAETYVEEGDVYFTKGDYKNALKAYQSSIQLLLIESDPLVKSETFNKPDLTIGSGFTYMDALYKKSYSLFKLGEFQKAADISDRLQKQVDRHRRKISDRESKKYLLESTKKFFELMIEIQYNLFSQSQDLEHINKAMSLFDASKASILYDALSQNTLSNTSEQMQYLFDRERSFSTELTNLELDLLETDNDTERSVLKNTMLEFRNKISQVSDSILQMMNSNLDHKRDETIFEINQIRQFTPDKGQLLIQYFVGDQNTYAIAISDEASYFKSLGSSNVLKSSVSDFLEVLRNYQSSATEYVSAGLLVYNSLITPLLEVQSFSSLFIIPDDILSFIPFEALPVAALETGGFKEVDFLLEKSSVRYASSLSVFNLQKQSSLSHKGGFVGMSSDYKNMKGMSQLSKANTELQEINKLVDGEIFINEEASKKQFVKLGSKYSIMHLSLHGIVNLQEPSMSYLQFPSSKLDGSDSRLHAAEVYNLDLNYDMVVLSACETGSGILAKGEGILSMAHAFAYAGSKSTIMSLWRIPSSSTATIFKHFYSNLREGADKEVSLRLAKLIYLDHVKAAELLHPFYWAALVQYGDPGKVSFTAGRTHWKYLIILLIVPFLFYFISRSKFWASL